MKINLIVILLLYCTTVTNGQVNTNLTLIQGIWQYSFPTEPGSIFKIVKDKKCLEFIYAPNSGESNHVLFRMIVGFQDSVNSSYEHEEIDTNSFRADGLYYTEIISEEDITADGLVEKPNFIVPSYFECDGQLLSMSGRGILDYDKIAELPHEVVEYLYYRGSRDKQDYLRDYLNLKVIAIKPLKCTLYSKPDKTTDVQLTRGDVVIVTEEAGKWLKVKYSESGIGWINKDDVRE
jgi:hypothetical protein